MHWHRTSRADELGEDYLYPARRFVTADLPQSIRCASNASASTTYAASQDLRDLDIQEMWGMKCFARRAQTCSHLAASRCDQEKFQDRRSIDDDHRVSRSLRTASAREIRGEMRDFSFWCKRSRFKRQLVHYVMQCRRGGPSASTQISLHMH